MSPFDVDAVRRRFPALGRLHDGRQMAFFDGPGGTQVPETVIEALSRYYRESNANHGGAARASLRAHPPPPAGHRRLAALLAAAPARSPSAPHQRTLPPPLSRSA